MPQKMFTAKFVRSAKTTKTKEVFSDTGCDNLALIVRKSGTHTWVWRGRVDGELRNITLGASSVHTLGAAREWATKLTESRDAKQDVIEIVKASTGKEEFLKRLTCDALFDIYMENGIAHLRSKDALRSLYNRDLSPKIGKMKVVNVDHDLLMGILRQKRKVAPAASNQLESLLSAWFNWSVKGGSDLTKMTVNPAANIVKLYKIPSRTRFLVDYEIGLLLKAIPQFRSRLAIPTYLLIYLGLRRAEVFEAEWSEFDLDKAEWLIPSDRMKNKWPHMVPLVEPILSLLKSHRAQQASDGVTSTLVFPSRLAKGEKPLTGYSDWVEDLNAKMQWFAMKDGKIVKRWSFHDLRRTFSTGLNSMRKDKRRVVDKDIIEQCLAHKQGGIQETYDIHDYFEEKRDALLAWADHIETIKVLFDVPKLPAPLLAVPLPGDRSAAA